MGRSRAVLLDEQNARFDEVARMRIWELITKERFWRTILITESNTDVLEALGDRVSILSHGELQCADSTAFVKQMYGKGYRLVNLEGQNVESVSNFLRQYMPPIEVASEIGNKIGYVLDEKHCERFNEIFKEFENNTNILHLNNFTLRRMNFYYIYVKMGFLNPALEKRGPLIDVLNGKLIYLEENYNLRFLEIKSRVKGVKLIFQQFYANFVLHCRFLMYYKTVFLKSCYLHQS
uniref:ABC transporter domain-containing protein n=1 Tax=Glossina austeni TaxID=7395 RepID=A0A1A9UDT4_GLOAU